MALSSLSQINWEEVVHEAFQDPIIKGQKIPGQNIYWAEVDPDIEADWNEIHKYSGECVDGAVKYRMRKAQMALMSTFAKHSLPLSELKKWGVFHKISRRYADPLLVEWSKTKKANAQWIANGSNPGIWCGLLHRFNARLGCPAPTYLQFTFSAKYKLYDPDNKEHDKLWKAWSSVKENLAKPNPWENVVNYRKESMQEQMHRKFQMPYHKSFFEENNFGACLVQWDYVALCILLEDSIESIEDLGYKY